MADAAQVEAIDESEAPESPMEPEDEVQPPLEPLNGWDPYTKNLPEAFAKPPSKPPTDMDEDARRIAEDIYQAKASAWRLRRKDEEGSAPAPGSDGADDLSYAAYARRFKQAQKALQITRAKAFLNIFKREFEQPRARDERIYRDWDSPNETPRPLIAYNIQYESGKSLAVPSIDSPMACPYRFCLDISFQEFEHHMKSEYGWGNFILDKIGTIMLSWGPDLSKQLPARHAMRRLGLAINSAFAAKARGNMGAAFKLHKVRGTDVKEWSQAYTFNTKSGVEIQGNLTARLTIAAPFLINPEFFIDGDTQDTIQSWLDAYGENFKTYMLEIRVENTYPGETARTLVTTHYMAISPYDEVNVRGQFFGMPGNVGAGDNWFCFKRRGELKPVNLNVIDMHAAPYTFRPQTNDTIVPFSELKMYEILVQCLKYPYGENMDQNVIPPTSDMIERVLDAMRAWGDTEQHHDIADHLKNTPKAAKTLVNELLVHHWPPIKVVFYSTSSLAFLVITLKKSTPESNAVYEDCNLPGAWLGLMIQYPVLFWNPIGHMSMAQKVWLDRLKRLETGEKSKFEANNPEAAEKIRQGRLNYQERMRNKATYDQLDRKQKAYLRRYDPASEYKTYRTARKVGELVQKRWRQFHPGRDDVWPVDKCIPDKFYVNYIPIETGQEGGDQDGASTSDEIQYETFWNDPFVIQLDKDNKEDNELFRRLYQLKIKFQNMASEAQERADLWDGNFDVRTARSFYGFRSLLPNQYSDNAVKYPWGYYLMACEKAFNTWVELWVTEINHPRYADVNNSSRFMTLSDFNGEDRAGKSVEKTVARMKTQINMGDEPWFRYLRREDTQGVTVDPKVQALDTVVNSHTQGTNDEDNQDASSTSSDEYQSDDEYTNPENATAIKRKTLGRFTKGNFEITWDKWSEDKVQWKKFGKFSVHLHLRELLFIRPIYVDPDTDSSMLRVVALIKCWLINLVWLSDTYTFDNAYSKPFAEIVNLFADRNYIDFQEVKETLQDFQLEFAGELSQAWASDRANPVSWWVDTLAPLMRDYFRRHRIIVMPQYRVKE